MLDLTSRTSDAPISRGGPRFLAVFGSGLLLIWGVIALAAASVTAGGSEPVREVIALVLWSAAIFCLYAAFSEWHRGQLGCAAVSVVTFIIPILLAAPAWLIFWAFSGGLIGLSAFLSRPAGSVPRG